jgi:hypothetical protein
MHQYCRSLYRFAYFARHSESQARDYTEQALRESARQVHRSSLQNGKNGISTAEFDSITRLRQFMQDRVVNSRRSGNGPAGFQYVGSFQLRELQPVFGKQNKPSECIDVNDRVVSQSSTANYGVVMASHHQHLLVSTSFRRCEYLIICLLS